MKLISIFGIMIILFCIILPTGAEAGDDLHIVNQVNLTFDPDELVIMVGDTVQWVWNSLSHTVTSGTDPGDPEAGTLFDAPLDSSNPSFTYVFDEIGDVPYFCRPHYDQGMTGLIHVLGDTEVYSATWGRIKKLHSLER